MATGGSFLHGLNLSADALGPPRSDLSLVEVGTGVRW